MFSLIVAIVSVALAAALVIASVYYGGDVWGNAGSQAAAAKLSNDAEQIQAAIHLFRYENDRLPTSLDELTDGAKYLTKAPSNQWTSGMTFIHTDTSQVSEDVCLAFNRKRGVPLVPECSDGFYQNVVVCCRNTD